MKFEEIARKQRDKFDHIESVPSDLIWHGIQDNLRITNTRRIYLKLSIAASILVLVGAFLLLNINESGEASHQASMPIEFDQEESKYYRLANNKMDEINFSDLDKNEYDEIFEELAELDSMYNDLKLELSTIPDAEKAIQTAIKFHERRLHILELLEREIENRKRDEINESNIKI